MSTKNQDTMPEHACKILDALHDLRSFVYEEGQAHYEAWIQQAKALLPKDEADYTHRIDDEDFVYSAKNMAWYLALRQRDLRELQRALMPWGVSSLGRSEARVLENLDAVIETFRALCEQTPRALPDYLAYEKGNLLLKNHANLTLGMSPEHRRVRIMVTFPTEAAHDYELVRDLLGHGMNIARINCAHDDETTWQAMIDHVRRAERELQATCMIHMDLGGPKIRTEATSFEKKHRFFVGDTLLLSTHTPQSSDAYPYQVSITLPDILKQVEVGHTVWFDDGKIGAEVQGRIDEAQSKGVVLRVIQASTDGAKIRVEKGVNFPDTPLHLSALTPKDLEDLPFVAQYADMIGYSFVQTAEDVRLLQDALRQHTTPERYHEIALIAKIETVLAVRHLPEIIIQMGSQHNMGVMIARGDLAVELGFQRLAEMQEQILWVCEAAHVPVIWATQVFENFVKKGIPTRAEITDAAMSQRAECVMLNKGKQIIRGLSALDDVLVRMGAHQSKKTADLRALRSWTTGD
jgi:pyruvate kinase